MLRYSIILISFTLACNHVPSKSQTEKSAQAIGQYLTVEQIDGASYLIKDRNWHNSNVLVAKMPDGTVQTMLCKGSSDLGYLKHASVDKWERSSRSLLSLNVTTVILGHGSLGGKDLIEDTVKLAARAKKND